MAKRSLSRFVPQDMELVGMASWVGWFVLCGFLLFVRPIEAQTSQPKTLQSRVVEIEHELQPRFGPIRLHRIEELEDDVFVPISGRTNVESPFALYQLQQRRFFLQQGEIRQNVPAKTLPQYVAISQDGRSTYYLAGFPDSEENFKRLVSDYRLLIPQNRSDVKSRALYCAQIVFGVEPQQWISEEGQALRLAADHFFQEGDKDPVGQANRWLGSIRSKNPKTSTSMVIINNADGGYLVDCPCFGHRLKLEHHPRFENYESK